MRRGLVLALALVAAMFIAGTALYPSLPDMIPTHWNIEGEVDGYMDRFSGVFFLPFMSIALVGLLAFIPRIDPLKANIRKFMGYYDMMIAVMTALFAYIFLLTMMWSAGFSYNFSQALSPAFGLMFYFAGIMLEKSKRNWFIGIKTPWTISSDRVWDKTNKLGAKIFKISGALAFLGLIVPDYGLLVALVPAIVGSLGTVVYSYVEYQKHH